MSVLDYAPLGDGLIDDASYGFRRPGKLVAGISLILAGATGWAVGQAYRFLQSGGSSSVPSFVSNPTEQHKLYDDFLHYTPYSSKKRSDSGIPFDPNQGIEQVMVRLGPSGVLPLLNPKVSAKLFVYGPLGKALLERLTRRAKANVGTKAGCVYGARFNLGKGGPRTLASFLASPTGSAGDIVRGWLLYYSPEHPQKRSVADELHGYDPWSPAKAMVKRSEVHVVREDGTTEAAKWYFADLANGFVPSFPCPECNESFPSKQELTRHRRISGKKPYVCLDCNQSFAKSYNLKVHMRLHSGERPYQCEHCLRTFTQIGPLKSHIRIHTGEKPYKCQVCELPFRTAGTLHNHMKTHADISERFHTCPVCNKSFTLVGNLRRHLRHQHNASIGG
eukprot:gb/GEZN01009573.1/.p1 GENE.gb/GEZN01009573.1/~~gb/GEZN01009573.1/.p1  ORF type:complete len:391 (-),score=24.57 gb/GEZN01009573.1/:78-1250(-)